MEEEELTQDEVCARHNRYSRSRSASRSSSVTRSRRPKKRNRDPRLDCSDPDLSDRSPKRRKRHENNPAQPPPAANPPNQQPPAPTIRTNGTNPIQPASVPVRETHTYVNELEHQIDNLRGQLDGHTSIMEEVVGFCEKTLGIKLHKHPRMHPATIKSLYDVYRHIGWNSYKFLVNEEDRKESAQFLMDRGNWDFSKDVPDNAKEPAEFIDIYQPAMGFICNYAQSYVMTQVTKEIDKYMDEHDNKLPKSALPYSVLQRNIDLSVEANKQFVAWWCDKILPKHQRRD